MKKYLTIPVALIMLATVMQLSVAAHYCGGKIAAVKISLTGTEASCGMVSDHKVHHYAETSLSAVCCENEISVYSVDNNYSPSESRYREIIQNPVDFSIPSAFCFQLKYPSAIVYTSAGPPGYYPANAVSIADICVFRI